MRIDRLLQRGFTPRALALAACFGAAAGLGAGACNEADGTDPWPGAYPPEDQINRPKGGADAGRDAASAEDAALEASTDTDADPGGDAATVSDGAVEAAAASDASALRSRPFGF